MIQLKCECNCNKEDSSFLEIATIKMPECLYDAICVLNGRYGVGEERKEALGEKYPKVQELVNILAKYYD